MTRRFWAGLFGAAVLAGGMTMAAVAADEAPRERPGRRVERIRLAGGFGQLGVALEDVGAEDVARLKLAGERGARVTEVHEGSAAEKAGIKDGDVILQFGGDQVRSAAQLARLVRETPAGRKVEVEVSREGASQRMTVTLARPEHDVFGFGPGGFGPGGLQRALVPTLARAAVAVGVAGIFLETHPDPDKALSDGPNNWPLDRLEPLLRELQSIDEVVKSR